MHPRHQPRVLLLALAAVALAACATGPPRREETPAIREIRDEYLRANPGGPFNAVITRGEIAVGMGYYDVLAAWGVPDQIEVSKREERWCYVLRDANEVDWVRYDLLFIDRVVSEWETSRNVASGFVPTPDDPRGVSRRVPASTPGSPGEGGRKRDGGSTLH
jgi:hypothetical protein